MERDILWPKAKKDQSKAQTVLKPSKDSSKTLRSVLGPGRPEEVLHGGLWSSLSLSKPFEADPI